MAADAGLIHRLARAELDIRLARFPAVALLGPRQVGKTTLALQLAASRPGVVLDLEAPADLARLSDPALYLASQADKLVVLDEVQRLPELFGSLRGLIDAGRRSGQANGRFLLLGSASVDLIRQSSESLAGRISVLELGGLNLLEVGPLQRDDLWIRGGFPDSLLAAEAAASSLWREAFLRTYLERDIPQLGPRIAAATLRRFWTMLAHAQGSLLNAAALGRSLGVSGKTVSSHLDLLVDLLLVRRLQPLHANVGKRLTKAPKVYVRDSGLVHTLLGLDDREAVLGHPVAGASWEGFVLENLLQCAPGRSQAWFYRTAAGAEMDLVLDLPGGQRWAIEIKRSSAPRLSKGFHQARADLEPHHTFVVYAGDERFPMLEGVEAIGATELAAALRTLGPELLRPCLQFTQPPQLTMAATPAAVATPAAPASAAPPRLSLQCQVIGPDTTTIRSLDWDRSRFDIEFGLRNGTTYNSFLVRGERTALIDTSHLKFEATWLPLLQQQIDPKAIDVLIVSHTEPDHSGLIGHLLDLNPEIEVVASKVAIQFLDNQVHRPFKSRAVKSGDTLDLGTNPESGVQHRFEFLSAPNLHWPDTIFSFDHGSGILYTCDAFGLHYCSDELFDVDPGAIAPDFRFYYECLMGPNARSVLQAMKRMDALPQITTIAVGHGPLLRDHLNLWLDDYRSWSSERSSAEAYAAVCYVSQYGFCDRLSQALARGIQKAGAAVQLVDMRASDPQELSALVGEASAVVVPTWPANPDADLQASIGTLLAALKPKQWVACYDAFGGNDEPIDTVAGQLRALGQKSAFEPLRIRQVPQNGDYQRCEEAGTDLGQLLTKARTIAAMKALDGDIDKALGRISGGLYVVTARQSDGEGGSRSSAMVASWVSQASFEPPGITVAVAKDRAIEALLQVGDRFVLNILRDDNHQQLLRHFLKRFPPGADRFAGVSTLDGVAAGGPVLGDALAFLGCRVAQRLEGPDHWIIYATVEEGNVADTEAATAVHHRKVGNHY